MREGGGVPAAAGKTSRSLQADRPVRVLNHVHEGPRIGAVVKRRVEGRAQCEQSNDPGELPHRSEDAGQFLMKIAMSILHARTLIQPA
jgi:hypothetical protein